MFSGANPAFNLAADEDGLLKMCASERSVIAEESDWPFPKATEPGTPTVSNTRCDRTSGTRPLAAIFRPRCPRSVRQRYVRHAEPLPPMACPAPIPSVPACACPFPSHRQALSNFLGVVEALEVLGARSPS